MMNDTSKTNLGSSAHHGLQNDKSDSTANAVSSTVEKGKHFFEVAGVRAKKANDMMVFRVKQNPLYAVGIALGAGFGLALLRR